MAIQWQLVATSGGWLAGTTAVLALVWNWRQSRVSRHTELLLRHYDRFYNPEMRRIRQAAARQLIEKQTPNYELEDLLDHFGVIGALLERKAIDYGIVHALFDWWILRWWHCSYEYICARRNDTRDPDDQMWFYLQNLVNRIAADRKRRGFSVLPQGALQRFLLEESRTLDVRITPANESDTREPQQSTPSYSEPASGGVGSGL